VIRTLLPGALVDARGFRVRGIEVSRVEALSDAVFGFAITLLVVSLEAPTTYRELITLMSGFFAFGATFAQLLMIWYIHYVFFRRYGLQDFTTIMLNAVLLFVVVFYIYPLKFMFTLLFALLVPLGNVRGAGFEPAHSVSVMVIYSMSVVVVYGVFVAMFGHAMRRRDALALDALEVHLTRSSINYCLIWVFVGLVSIGIAVIGGPGWVPIAGMAYALLGPLQAWNGFRGARLAPRRAEPQGAT
jgi:uncharacterized membrane protein